MHKAFSCALVLAVASGAAGQSHDGFFAVYEANRTQAIPSYITEDFVVRAYAMVLGNAVTEFEEAVALPALRELVPLVRHKLGSATEPEQTAQGYLAVLEALLLGRNNVALVGSAASEELEAVLAARGLKRSPLVGQEIDYSQFRVRGKYALNADLGHYFRAVRYAGTALFPLLHSRATGVTAAEADRLAGAALLISAAITGDSRASELHAQAIGPLGYLFGAEDAMTVQQYAQHGRRAGGLDVGGAELPRLRLELFAAGVRPRVLGGVVDLSGLESGVSAADALAGWQLLPGRSSPESVAFQELVSRSIGGYRGQGTPFTLGLLSRSTDKGIPDGLGIGGITGVQRCAATTGRGVATGNMTDTRRLGSGRHGLWNWIRAWRRSIFNCCGRGCNTGKDR